MQTIVQIHPSWQKQESHLMRRLHQIVSGDGNGPFAKDSGYPWQLDCSNDWWASLDGTQLTVAHRYRQDKSDAVAKLAELLFA